MSYKENIKLAAVLSALLFVVFGCARRPPDIIPVPVEEEEVEIVEVIPDSGKLFGVYLMDFPEKDSSDYFLYKKVLSEWRDILDYVSRTGKPLAIAKSNRLIRALSEIERESIKFPEIIEKPHTELSKQEVEYLDNKYSLSSATRTLVFAQIREAVSFTGDSLKEDEVLVDIMVREAPGEAEKERLLKFLKDEIAGFPDYLRISLENENLQGAAASLSDAYFQLLTPERVRVQVLEGLLGYKNLLGRFPDGFIPRGGYINEVALRVIESADLKWIIAASSEPVTYLTEPLVIPVFQPSQRDTNLLLSDNYSYFTGSLPGASFLSPEEYIENASYLTTAAVRISESEFLCAEMNLTPRHERIRTHLSEATGAIQEYRNSGRASLRVLNAALRYLAEAESGRFADEEYYDEKFSGKLISLYRTIGYSPPNELFLSLSDPSSHIIPEIQVSSEVSPDIDGVISPGEWDGGSYQKFNSSLSVRWGYDGNNIYAAFISPVDLETAGLFIGHMDVPSAAIYRRGESQEPIGFPLFIEAAWSSRSPGLLGIFRTTGDERWERITHLSTAGRTDEALEVSLPLRYLDHMPDRNIYLKFSVNDEIFPPKGRFEIPSPEMSRRRGIISQIDSAGDNRGPGNYSIPERFSEHSGNFDFRGIDVYESQGDKIISIEFSSLGNPLEAPLGFSPQIIDVYIDVNARPGLGRTSFLNGRRAFTTPVDAWEYCVTLSGWKKGIYNAAGQRIGEPDINVNPVTRTINIFIRDGIIPTPVENWGIIPVLIPGDDLGFVSEIMPDGSGEEHYTGRRHDSDPNILDLILPSGHSQSRILGAGRRGGSVEIPALRDR